MIDPNKAEQSPGAESSPENEHKSTAERRRALLERERELEREERSLDVRNETLDTRLEELGARRSEIRELESKADEVLLALVTGWPPEDHRRDEFIRQYSQLAKLVDDIAEQRTALAQERQQTEDQLLGVDAWLYDIESRALNLRTTELNDATRQIESKFGTWYEDVLVHMSDDAAWRQIGVDEYQATAGWREQMAVWLRIRLDLVDSVQEWGRKLDELNRSKERFHIAVNRYYIERDKLRRESEEFFAALAEQNQALGAGYTINDKVRRHWISNIESQTERIPKRVLSQVLGIMFEFFCVDLLEAMGFEEVTWQGGANDGGVDIWASEVSYSGDILNVAVQCKFKGKNGRVGPNDVVLFHGKLPIAEQYYRKIVMTFGRIEAEAVEQGAKYGVEFWDGQRLCKEMARHKVGLQLVHEANGHDLAIDGEWWDELIERAQAEHEGRTRA